MPVTKTGITAVIRAPAVLIAATSRTAASTSTSTSAAPTTESTAARPTTRTAESTTTTRATAAGPATEATARTVARAESGVQRVSSQAAEPQAIRPRCTHAWRDTKRRTESQTAARATAIPETIWSIQHALPAGFVIAGLRETSAGATVHQQGLIGIRGYVRCGWVCRGFR
jgi:hypothetical protein